MSNTENVQFRNRDGLRMVGTIVRPDSTGPHPGVLFIHGLGGHRNERHVRAICDGLTDQGIATLRVDLTKNRGESDGRFEDMTLTGEVNDAGDALAYFRTMPAIDGSLVGVAGHSFGGLVTALLAAADPTIQSIAPLSPVFDMRRRLFDMLGPQGLEQWRETDERPLGGGMIQRYSFWEDLQAWDIPSVVRTIRTPTFVLIGSGSDELPLSNAEGYMLHLASDWRRFHMVGGAGHTYDQESHLKEVVRSTEQWFLSTLVDR